MLTIRSFHLPFAAALLALHFSAGPASGQTADARTEISAVNARFMDAVKRGDAAGVAALYSKSAQLFPTHSDIVSGRQAIEKFWRDSMRAGIRGGSLTTLEVEVYGNTAWETGEYTMRGDGGKVFDRGKYLVIWKREQGEWKLHRDIWNTNLEPVTDNLP